MRTNPTLVSAFGSGVVAIGILLIAPVLTGLDPYLLALGGGGLVLGGLALVLQQGRLGWIALVVGVIAITAALIKGAPPPTIDDISIEMVVAGDIQHSAPAYFKLTNKSKKGLTILDSSTLSPEGYFGTTPTEGPQRIAPGAVHNIPIPDLNYIGLIGRAGIYFAYQFEGERPAQKLGYALFAIPRPMAAGTLPPSSCCERSASLRDLREAAVKKINNVSLSGGGFDYIWSPSQGPVVLEPPIAGLDVKRQFEANPFTGQITWAVIFPDGEQKLVRTEIDPTINKSYTIKAHFRESDKAIEMTVNGLPADQLPSIWPERR